MRAYRFDTFTNLDALRLHEIDKPKPQRGELLLRIHAVSLNYRDVAMVSGRYPSPAKPGLIPTSDAAAEVVEVGEGVRSFNVGDRVIGIFHPRWFGGKRPDTLVADSYGSGQDGWLSEYKIVAQEAVVALPDSLSWEEGATLPCAAATAWNALGGSRPIRAGDTVLTLGTGGTSIFAVQLAKALGARVISTTSSTAKAEKLRALGADEVVNYRDVENWGADVKELTGGRGVDRVVEVGGPATINQSLAAIGDRGEIVLIGFLGKDNPGIDYFAAMRTTLRGITVGDRQNLKDLVHAVATCRIKPVIDRVFEYDDAKAAFEHLEAGRHVGKIVIRVSH